MNSYKISNSSVVFAIHAMSGGGAERVVLDLVNNWPDERYQPVLLLAQAKGAYVRHIAEHVKVVSLDLPTSFLHSFSVARRIRECLVGHHPVAIISHLSGMNRLMLRARKLGAFSAPVIVVEHNNIGRKFNISGRSGFANALVKREMTWLYSGAHAVVGVSQGVAEDIRKHLGVKDNVRVVYNPVDLDKIRKMMAIKPEGEFPRCFEGLPRPIILSAGRLHPQKAFDDLIRAFALIPEYVRGSLVILGQGELKNDLKAIASSLGIAEHVHLPGFTANPWWYMSSADLFALTSHWEGYGMVLLEALACGLPIVATDCEYGPREIISQTKKGKLAPVGDVQAIASTIRAVLADPKGSSNASTQDYLDRLRPAEVAQSYLDLALNGYHC
jgi:glycosyltransferase involved in cell wall biosynthesis